MDAEQDERVKGVLLEIDSSGGSPAAAYEVAQFIQSMGKPVVAYIRDMGDSAAYWIAIAADQVLATPVADIGSIGVTSSYVDTVQQDKDDGKTFVELSTAPHKDYGNPSRTLLPEEKDQIVGQMQLVHHQVVTWVSERRPLSYEEASSFANGFSWNATDALNKGLIDGVGDMGYALEVLSSLTGEGRMYLRDDICWGQK